MSDNQKIKAMKRFIGHVINDKTVEFEVKCRLSVSQSTSRVLPVTQIGSDSVSQLNNFCAKNHFQCPKYELIGQSGEPHNPTFTFRCSLSVNGQQIVGNGRGCPKSEAKRRSAHSVITQLRQLEASRPAPTTPLSAGPSGIPKVDTHSGKSCHKNKVKKMLRQLRQMEASLTAQTTSPLTPEPSVVPKADIHSYIRQKLNDCRQLQEVVESDLNSDQKLIEVAVLLDSRLEYLESDDQGVLRLLANGLDDYPLVTTFGSGHNDSDVNRSIAQKKAILSIKILYTN